MDTILSDAEILREIGRRLRRERLNRDLTQARLAELTGLGRSTIAKAESGGVTTVGTLVALLRGLRMLDRLDVFLPEPALSPIQLAKMKGHERQRASREGSKQKGVGDPWEWEG